MPKLSEIRAQFPMYADVSDEQLLKGLHQKYYSDMPFTDFSKSIENDSKPPQKESMLDAPNAMASGFNRGLTRLAGLPVDTMANVLDLGRAAIGAPYTAITGRPVPAALQVTDRASVPGSGDWLLKQAGKNAVTSAAVNPQNPAYEGGYAQAAGGAASSLFRPTGLVDAARQTGMNVTSGLLGKAAGDLSGSTEVGITASMLPTLLSGGRRAPPQNTAKTRTLDAARAEGYVVPPSHAGAGWVNSRLESIAGKAALKQAAILRNQEVTNRVAARGIGLAPGAEITPSQLSTIRADAGRLGYTPIDQIPSIPTTPNYANRILDIEDQYGRPNSPITSLRNPDVSTLASELLPTQFTGRELNDLVKSLRETGNKSANLVYGVTPASKTLGEAQVAGSRALENLLDTHLMQAGPSNILHNLQQTRRQIGEAHTLEKALNPATGDVDAQVFGQRVLNEKPIAGDFKTIGDFAAAFPDVARPAAGSPTPGVSALEAAGVPALSLAGALASGSPYGILAGALPLARAPVRNMLLSRWYQQRFAREPGVKQALSPEETGALSKFLLTSGILEGEK